jgi:hypothetical protein
MLAGWCPVLIGSYFQRPLLENRYGCLVRLHRVACKLPLAISCLQLWVAAAQYCCGFCWYGHVLVGLSWQSRWGFLEHWVLFLNGRLFCFKIKVYSWGFRHSQRYWWRFTLSETWHRLVWLTVPTFQIIAVSTYAGLSSQTHTWVNSLTSAASAV